MPPENGKNFSTSSLRFGRILLDIFGGRFAGEEASRWSRLIFLIVTALILSVLITPHQQLISTTYKAGDIAGASVRANQDYLLEDTHLTDRKRKEAEVTAPLVYAFNPTAAAVLRQRLGLILELVRQARVSPDLEMKRSLRKKVSEVSGFEVDAGDLESLARLHNDQLTGEITRLTNQVYERLIVGNNERFANDLLHGVIVTEGPPGGEVPPQNYQQFLGVDEARQQVEQADLPDGGDRHDLAVLKGFLGRMMKPNLLLNREGSEKKRIEARDSVKPVMFQVKRGEIIVREGERIREDQAQKLAMIYQSRSGIGRLFMVLGVFGLTLIMLIFPYRFACKNIRKFNPSSKDLLLLTYITLGLFLGLRLSLVVTSAIGGMFPYIHVTDYYYLFPFALGAMLVRILINSEVALVYTSVCALLAGILFENSLVIVIYALMTGIVMAGRTGASFAAVLGTMTVNSEVDALETMNFPPMEFLVAPRILAMILMMPLLVLYADLFGILGGYVVAVGLLDLTPALYLTQTREAMTFSDVLVGLLKAPAFGAVVALAGTYFGMKTGRTASAVGVSTTRAVVSGILLVIVVDAILTVFFYAVKL
ncbi:MAG: ABC transporter permease [Deltaproteobacteria bacterium]